MSNCQKYDLASLLFEFITLYLDFIELNAQILEFLASKYDFPLLSIKLCTGRADCQPVSTW